MIKTSAIAQSSKEQKKNVIAPRKNYQLREELIPYFLSHQAEWIRDDSPFAACAKGRRTGITYATCYKANEGAILNKFDTYYSTYSLDATRSFIKNCALFAKACNTGFQLISGTQIIEDSEIQTLSLVYRNGRTIKAIPGNAVNLRDRQGLIVIDEAAFRKDLPEILDAGFANNIWGGMIRLISTHFGSKNPFNLLCKDLMENPDKGNYYFTPFKKAIENGLYKRVCYINKTIWTPENEEKWIEALYKRAGSSASQEFDGIPSDYSGESVFPREIWKEQQADEDNTFSLKLRAWDLANTDQSVAKSTHFYTANVAGYCSPMGQLVISDWDAKQVADDKGDNWIREMIMNDGANSITLIELEGGSEASKYINYIKRSTPIGRIEGIRPQKQKLLRALPCVRLIIDGSVVLSKNMKNKEEFLRICELYTGEKIPLIQDVIDALSLLIDYWNRKFNQNSEF